ncbi:MAG TPA: hypothetical protein VN673_03895, partial [Clostridia bacterium]|nr:hypothetical protein [Clostridia bacterium]
MPTGPQKIILIRSGRYEYAEIDINGALQIVGPNNTGKTTLINTLQFLYLDDRRHMDFGSYTPDQTKEFYFPNQYSYVLFECLGVNGACVVGWRGQSKTSGGEPERFYHLGPYDEADFLNEDRQVREPRDVNARLALKQYRVLKSAQEHRELLLIPTNSESRGLGIVALRDSDKYHQFRETLKCLLMLSAISQEQMRDRLLMLADIPPDRTALDIRALFGEDYDRIRQRRERLLRFKKNQDLVERLVRKFAERETARGELIYRWTDLRAKRQEFERAHDAALEQHRAQAQAQADQLKILSAELQDRRRDLTTLAEQKGGLSSQLAELDRLEREFAGFVEDLERTAVANLKHTVRTLENQLANAGADQLEKARQRVAHYNQLVKHKEETICHFDHLAVTALRKQFSDDELNGMFRLLNPNLLELPVGTGGVDVKRQSELLAALRGLLGRLQNDVYEDENVALHLRTHSLPLAGLEDVQTAREQLKDYKETLEHWQRILNAIEQREKLHAEFKAKIAELEQMERRLFSFEAYQKKQAE